MTDPGRFREFIEGWAITGPSSAWWHLVVPFDWRGLLNLRAKQKAYLARYARQDMIRWASRPVTEIAAAVRAVSEIVHEENAFVSVTEDR